MWEEATHIVINGIYIRKMYSFTHYFSFPIFVIITHCSLSLPLLLSFWDHTFFTLSGILQMHYMNVTVISHVLKAKEVT